MVRAYRVTVVFLCAIKLRIRKHAKLNVAITVTLDCCNGIEIEQSTALIKEVITVGVPYRRGSSPACYVILLIVVNVLLVENEVGKSVIKRNCTLVVECKLDKTAFVNTCNLFA